MSRRVSIRPAAEDEAIDVIRLFEGALLTVDFDTLRDAIAHGAVFVAVRADYLVGAVYLDCDREPPHIEAIAVHPSHRRDGIGGQLLGYVVTQYGSVTAAFDSELRPFYESIGCTIEPFSAADGAGGITDTDDRLFARLFRQ